ncbi:MAG: response regulator [Bacteroidota bacterium]
MKYKAIVIDDSTIQCLATSVLVKNHPQLEFAGCYSDPYEGIKTIYDNKIDIVFLDVLMEKVDAFELMDNVEIKSAIILNSTWSRFAVKAFEYGVNDFLIKPLPKAKFYRSVEKVIQQIESKKAFEKKIETYLFSETLSNLT